MLQKINETNESFVSNIKQNYSENTPSNTSKSLVPLKSGSSTNFQSIINPSKKQKQYNNYIQNDTSSNKISTQINLDNNQNIIVEDYEDGESIAWYRQNYIDEIDGDELFYKNDFNVQNVLPQISKLHHEKINDQQKYIIKDLETGNKQDIRERYILSQLKGGTNIIPQEVNMNKCWSKWWEKKKEINKQFLKACQLNFVDKIIEFMNIEEKDLRPILNQLDDSGYSPLHYAAQFGNLQIANLIIAHDGDLEIQNYQDQTPLTIAVHHNHEQLVFLLLSAGCDLNVKDLKLNTPLHYAFMNGNKTIIEALMRKPALNPEEKNLEDKQAFELCYDTDLIRLYDNLMQKRVEIIAKLEKNKVQIVDTTADEINQTFSHQKLFDNIQIENQDSQNNQNQSNQKNQKQLIYNKVNPSKEHFEVIGQIGKGSFGEVFLVQHFKTNNKYALKMLRKTDLIKQQMLKYAFTERNILSQSTCPFVAKLHYAFQTSDKLFLVMDYGQLGDLGTHLQVSKRFDEDKTKFYSAQVLIAIEHLHSKHVIYRDLKSDNIVVCDDGYIKLTDFGLAKENVPEFSSGAQSFCGSIAYMPPEMLKKQTTHGKSIDLYLFGVLLYELLTGSPPFFSMDRQKLYNNIQFSQVQFPNYVSKSAKNLIQKLLSKDPRFRPTYDEVKKHSFFKTIDWQKLYKKELVPPQPTLTKEKYKKVYTDIYEQEFQVQDEFEQAKQQQNQHLQSWTFVQNPNMSFVNQQKYNQQNKSIKKELNINTQESQYDNNNIQQIKTSQF